jgi:hypothetical protein
VQDPMPVFVKQLPAHGKTGVPSPGSGRPGVPRPGMKQTPTARQPNRGLTLDDPEFTCTKCQTVKPMEEAHTVAKKGGGRRLTGRCRPCALALQRAANNKQAAKWRGPDYVLPAIKDQESFVVDGVRQCLSCDEAKPLSSFYEDHTVASGYQAVCRACRGRERRVRYASMTSEQRELYTDQTWIAWIWRTYRMTVEDFERLAEAQDWVCAICYQSPDTRLCVDHDHDCCLGKRSCGQCVRQLLCHYCNVIVGFVESGRATGADIDAYVNRHKL